jgi:hypothetical protein
MTTLLWILGVTLAFGILYYLVRNTDMLDMIDVLDIISDAFDDLWD